MLQFLGSKDSPALRLDLSGVGAPTRKWVTWRGRVEKGGVRVCVFEGCFKTVEIREMKHVHFSELFLLFLLHSSYIFVSSLDEGVCAMVKFPLGEMEKKSTNFNGRSGGKLTVQVRCLNFLYIFYRKQRNSDLGTELHFVLRRCLKLQGLKSLVNEPDWEVETFYLK